jgi:hypothetical protein
MNTLNDLREQWEMESEVILEVPRTAPEPELYVITKSDVSGEFRLSHYFMISDEWQISIDVDFTEDIIKCLKDIKDNMSDVIHYIFAEL